MDDPSVGDHVCLSGATSHTTCGLRIEGLNATICDNGCTSFLLRYDQDGSACAPGDSGAPVFDKPDATHNARIYGQHVGEIPTGCVGEHISSLLVALNVQVATSPN